MAANDILVTRRQDGTLVIAAWNLVDPGQQGADKQLRLNFKGLPPGVHVSIQVADSTHGNTLASYQSMGSPRYPTPSQVDTINRAAGLPKALPTPMKGDSTAFPQTRMRSRLLAPTGCPRPVP